MAFPHPPGLLPAEVAFLCEMEMVTVVPRQRLERLDLLGGPTNPLIPPQRTSIPLWLALLLKRQRRINILPPPWLEPDSLREILDMETVHFQDSFSPAPTLPSLSSNNERLQRNEAVIVGREVNVDGKSQYLSPPFTLDATAQAQAHALPYHWHALSELILNDASDDVLEPDTVRNLLRDIREVRLAKMRKGVDVLTGDGEGVRLDGVGSMELAESRGFVVGVMDGLRRLGASKEAERRDGEARDAARADDDEDDDMLE